MSGLVQEMSNGRQLLGTALANLVAAHQRDPHPALAATIEVVRAEIELVVTLLNLHETVPNRQRNRDAAEAS